MTLIGNVGAGSGASLEHPHEQLFATPVVPPLLLETPRVRAAPQPVRRLRRLRPAPEDAGERLVLGGAVGAWAPEASRFNGELWLAPAAHEADFRDADPAILAPSLRLELTAVRHTLTGAPLNFWLHTAPADLRGTFHWHLELAPRTATLAGFELGSDIALVTKDPAVAAAEYRAALPPV